MGDINIKIKSLVINTDMRTATPEKLSCVCSIRTTPYYKDLFDDVDRAEYEEVREAIHTSLDTIKARRERQRLRDDEDAALMRHFRAED